MKVAINGVGIAGPTLAYWLRRAGHEPVLFERAPAFRRGGYLIDFWGLGYDIAERMGILPTLRERGYVMKRMRNVRHDGREEAGMDFAPLYQAQQGRFISIARADLARALVDACVGVPVHFGVSINGIAQHGDGPIVTLSDGRQERFDLVVGADGLHSQVRALAFGPEPRFERFLDCHVAACRVSGYPHRDELMFVSHTVRGRQAARVSLRDGETLVLFICRDEFIGDDPGRHDDPRRALRRAFGGMGWEVPELLDAMENSGDLYFDRVSQIRMPHWSSNRIALVGDAAACPSLLAGEGTGLGMLGAYVLAGELHRAGSDIARALAAYENSLRAFISGKQKGAVYFRGFFAPQTALGLVARNLAVHLFALPLFGRQFWARSLRDRFTLPDYPMD
ncbi:MAG: FAD-binding domain [Proteobacteria bacterium]|nr:FAD-binding domain [Pseudomonadota bacterium]